MAKEKTLTHRNEFMSKPEDRETWEKKAEAEGLDFSTWARRALNAEAAR